MGSSTLVGLHCSCMLLVFIAGSLSKIENAFYRSCDLQVLATKLLHCSPALSWRSRNPLNSRMGLTRIVRILGSGEEANSQSLERMIVTIIRIRVGRRGNGGEVTCFIHRVISHLGACLVALH